MTPRRQPLDLNFKTQSQITGEQDAIIKSIYGASRGNIQSKTVLDGTINKTPLNQTTDELNDLIDRMNERELRYNLKTLVNRLDGIATRDGNDPRQSRESPGNTPRGRYRGFTGYG